MGGEAQAIVKDRPLLPAEHPFSTLVTTRFHRPAFQLLQEPPGILRAGYRPDGGVFGRGLVASGIGFRNRGGDFIRFPKTC